MWLLSDRAVIPEQRERELLAGRARVLLYGRVSCLSEVIRALCSIVIGLGLMLLHLVVTHIFWVPVILLGVLAVLLLLAWLSTMARRRRARRRSIERPGHDLGQQVRECGSRGRSPDPDRRPGQ